MYTCLDQGTGSSNGNGNNNNNNNSSTTNGPTTITSSNSFTNNGIQEQSDWICFNFGKELYTYAYRGVKKVDYQNLMSHFFLRKKLDRSIEFF